MFGNPSCLPDSLSGSGKIEPPYREARMRRVMPIDCPSDYMFPPSLQEWLPREHVARIVVDVIDQPCCCPPSFEPRPGRSCTQSQPTCIDFPIRFPG